MTLSEASIKKAIKEINDYRNSIKEKTHKFCVYLAKKGYDIAQANVGGFEGITFEIQEPSNGNAILVGFSSRQLRTWWNKKEGQVKNYDYSPILMAEFGSGSYALDGNRGTFPTGKHNGKRDEWAYRVSHDAPLVWTDGEQPTRPMHKAFERMYEDARVVAWEIFNE